MDGHLKVLGLTQPAVLTLEWIRGLLLVSPSASVVYLLLTIPQSIPSGTFSVKKDFTVTRSKNAATSLHAFSEDKLAKLIQSHLSFNLPKITI